MRRLLSLIVVIAALALPGQALAGGVPTGSAGATQYIPPVPSVTPPSQPTLPFTGEDVLLVVLTGLVLAGGGYTLYRQVRER